MERTFHFFVYIFANKTNKVLYTGVTNDLERRCYEHKNKLLEGFTQKNNLDKPVCFESFNYIDKAIQREKQIKGYSRKKKIALIEEFNKSWNDLIIDGKILSPAASNNNPTCTN